MWELKRLGFGAWGAVFIGMGNYIWTMSRCVTPKREMPCIDLHAEAQQLSSHPQFLGLGSTRVGLEALYKFHFMALSR